MNAKIGMAMPLLYSFVLVFAVNAAVILGCLGRWEFSVLSGIVAAAALKKVFRFATGKIAKTLLGLGLMLFSDAVNL